jgi:hypothetical protein
LYHRGISVMRIQSTHSIPVSGQIVQGKYWHTKILTKSLPNIEEAKSK